MRYQILVNRNPDGSTATEVSNFFSKADALRYKRKLEKQGYQVSFWDTRNNPMSSMFRLG